MALLPRTSTKPAPTRGPVFCGVFRPISASKVHSLDPQHLFRPHFGFEGPSTGPSAAFSASFRLRRSIPWTISTCFVLIPASKVHSLDPQHLFRPHFGFEGPFPGPSAAFSASSSSKLAVFKDGVGARDRYGHGLGRKCAAGGPKGPPVLRFADKSLIISLNIITFANQINRLLHYVKTFLSVCSFSSALRIGLRSRESCFCSRI